MTNTSRNFKWNGINFPVPKNKNFLLYPWDGSLGINKTTKRKNLIEYRPLIPGHKSIRICKDLVYSMVIQNHLRRFQIKGPYLGLAAAYTPEIYTILNKFIHGSFVNCQIDNKAYKQLNTFNPKIVEAYKSHKVDFQLYNEDVTYSMYTYRNEFAILDLDFMINLDKEFIAEVTYGIEQCAKNMVTVALWHCVGRSKWSTNHMVDTVYRPYLREQLRKCFYILRDDSINYHEAQSKKQSAGYPMRVEVLTLKRKKKWKKAS